MRSDSAPGDGSAQGAQGDAPAAGAAPPPGGAEITADDLHRMTRVLGLIPIPEHLMPKVLEHVRTHRAALRTFEDAGIDVGGVLTAQPFRA
jgi:hypothetical protein